ncbi:MAG: hypothetical protein PHH37_01965 [Paludibacter sp.]|nr:hypothetical protein [Paludibacter sp.]
MRTISTKLFILLIISALPMLCLNSQVKVGTVFTVKGNTTSYYDVTWLITYPETSNSFDNGYDAFKINSSTSENAPSIYSVGTDGIYQIQTTSDVNNIELGFNAGIDSSYTISITQYDADLVYNKLVLLDRITGIETDILKEGTTYTFLSENGSSVNRFLIYATKLGAADEVTDSTETDGVVDESEDVDSIPANPQQDSIDTEIPDSLPTDSAIDNQSGNAKDKYKHENKAKKVKIKKHGHEIEIENITNEKGYVNLMDIRRGQKIQSLELPANSDITIGKNIKQGAYLLVVNIRDDISTTSITIQ